MPVSPADRYQATLARAAERGDPAVDATAQSPDGVKVSVSNNSEGRFNTPVLVDGKNVFASAEGAKFITKDMKLVGVGPLEGLEKIANGFIPGLQPSK